MTPELCRALLIGLGEGLSDRRGDDGMLALRRMDQVVSHPMNATAPMRGIKHPRDRRLRTGVRVGNYQLETVETAGLQATQEVGPELFRLRGADGHADDLTKPVGVDRDGDCGR